MAFVDDVRNILGPLDVYWENVALRLEIWGFKPFQAAVLIAWMVAHQRGGKTNLSDKDAALLGQLENQLIDADAPDEPSASAERLRALLPSNPASPDWLSLRAQAEGIDPRAGVMAYLFAAFLRGELTINNLRPTIKRAQSSLGYR
ncbi:hypothetical protein [Xanthomonas sp. A1809]|uniref:hypothetical protein n=1 Tax=Xanthomonas sp. A1809 TaxID=2821275 RepID=UPI001ADBE1F0|nr:hypothetical protein [Xanthomonas sp. A1809]MBO9855826.1 hypothetical protein [Xanthomonas sp. A1809]MBZ2621145.1 hypothetical protein [Xanthomonas perforans]